MPARPPPPTTSTPTTTMTSSNRRGAAAGVLVARPGRRVGRRPRLRPPPTTTTLADRLEAAGAPAARLGDSTPRVRAAAGRPRRRAGTIPLAGSASAGSSRWPPACPHRGRRRPASPGWLSQVALAAVRRHGPRVGIVPTLRRGKRGHEEPAWSTCRVQWAPALVADDARARCARRRRCPTPSSWPSPPASARPRSMVNNDVVAGRGRLAMATPEHRTPPRPAGAAAQGRTRPRIVAETLITTQLNGSVFPAHTCRTWPTSVASPGEVDPLGHRTDAGPRLILAARLARRGRRLVPVNVLAPGDKGKLVPDRGGPQGRPTARPSWPPSELAPGSSGCCPCSSAPRCGRRRGQVVLSQDEAWELHDRARRRRWRLGRVRRAPARAVSRRKATAGTLRLFVEEAVGRVGRGRPPAVERRAGRCVFGDVELTAAEVAAPGHARPARSSARAVKLGRARPRRPRRKAAAALAERASRSPSMTGAEILRHGHRARRFGPRRRRHGARAASWAQRPASATRLEERADRAGHPTPEGFHGELRSYQAAGTRRGSASSRPRSLGGCLALDMGLGKTPTVLAHLSAMAAERRRADAERGPDDPAPAFTGPALVIAPARRGGQLGRRGPQASPRQLQRGRAPRRLARRGATTWCAEVRLRRHRHHHVRHRGARRGGAVPSMSWSPHRPRRGAGHQEPGERDVPAAASHPVAHARSRSPARPSRTASATSGPSSTSPTPASSARGPRSSPRCRAAATARARARTRCGRSTASSCSVAPRPSPRSPPSCPTVIDELDHCTMTPEQIGLYQAVLDTARRATRRPRSGGERRRARCSPPSRRSSRSATTPLRTSDDGRRSPAGRASWHAPRGDRRVGVRGRRAHPDLHPLRRVGPASLADHLTKSPAEADHTATTAASARGARDKMIADFQAKRGRRGAWCSRSRPAAPASTSPPPATSCCTTAGGTPPSRTRPATAPGASARTRTVVSHRLVCPGTVDERVEEVVAGKRHIAELVLARSASIADLDVDQLRVALGLRTDELLTETSREPRPAQSQPAPPRRQRQSPQAGRPLEQPASAARHREDHAGGRGRCHVALARRSAMNNGTAAGHYFHAVLERASAVATALAMSADLVAAPGSDDE